MNKTCFFVTAIHMELVRIRSVISSQKLIYEFFNYIQFVAIQHWQSAHIKSLQGKKANILLLIYLLWIGKKY